MIRSQISSRLKRFIIRRDFNICQCCGLVSISEIHHIKPVCMGGDDSTGGMVPQLILAKAFLLTEGRMDMPPKHQIAADQRRG